MYTQWATHVVLGSVVYFPRFRPFKKKAYSAELGASVPRCCRLRLLGARCWFFQVRPCGMRTEAPLDFRRKRPLNC